MSFLKGFAAIHLAFSRAKAAFDFDNAVEPPTSSITDENERLLLSGILRVNLSHVDATGTHPTAQVEEVAASSSGGVNPISPIVSEPVLEKATNVVMPIVVVPTPAALALEPAVPAETIPFTTRRRENPIRLVLHWRPAFGYLSRRKLLRTAAVILVIAVPATAGITVLFGKKDSAVPVAAAASQPAAAPEQSQLPIDIKQIPPSNFVPAPHVATLAAPIKPAAKETIYEKPKPITEIPRESVENSSHKASNAPEATEAPVDTAAVDRISRTIVVQVHVEQGRVTEAWVKNSNKELAAYEATAIRLARQRRYSADTTRTESVPVDLSVRK
jgi:hypothetical protein